MAFRIVWSQIIDEDLNEIFQLIAPDDTKAVAE